MRCTPLGIWNSGVTCLLISCLFFAVASGLVRLLGAQVGVFLLVCVRSGLSFLFSVALYKINTRHMDEAHPFFGSASNRFFLAMRGFVGSTAMVFFYEGLFRLPLGESVTILYMNPPLTAILAWVLLGEKFGPVTAGGCVVSFIGVVFVARPPFIFGASTVTWTHSRDVGLFYAGSSALLASGAYMAIRMIGNKETPLTVGVWFHTSALLSSTPFLLFGGLHAFPSARDWVCLVMIACCSFVANLLLNRGFQLEVAAKASAINFMQVVYAHLIGLIFFDEQPTASGLIGAGLIAVGLMAVTLSKKTNSGCDSDLPIKDVDEETIPLTASNIDSATAAEVELTLGENSQQQQALNK